MPFVNQYIPFIESEKSVSKTLILPRNIYRIVSYEYADGERKTLSGNKSSLVFVTGIFDKKIYCIKISEIKPDRFFKWLKTIFLKSLDDKRIDESKQLSELLIITAKSGSSMLSKLKSNTIYSAHPNAFRTYNLAGINQVKVVNLKKDTIKEYHK
jgi:hypothetical protein